MKIKRLSDIISRLIDVTTARTDQINDFTAGSVIRSIYEAVAMELESYYMLQEENVTYGIEHGVLDAFGFTRREAVAAYGYVTLTFYAPLSEDVVFPKGTQFSSSQSNYTQVYTLQQAYVASQGATRVNVQAFCTQPGTIGNIPANTIDSISGSQLGVASATNEEAFLTGTDEESLADVRTRFREYVDTRGRGTLKAMDYAARTVEEVTGVYVYEQTGRVTVYAHDANGDLPDNVAAKVRAIEEYYRPAGIPWSVEAVTKELEPLEVGLIVTNIDLATDSFIEGLEKYLANYLNTFSAGQNVLMADLYNRIMAYSPIIYDAEITTPSANVVIDPNQIVRAGDIDCYVDDVEGNVG